MVDSILDNLSLRTQRKAELNLQLDLSTPSAKIEEFIQAVRKILDRKEIENSTVLLNDISSHAFLIYVEYELVNGGSNRNTFNDFTQFLVKHPIFSILHYPSYFFTVFHDDNCGNIYNI